MDVDNLADFLVGVRLSSLGRFKEDDLGSCFLEDDPPSSDLMEFVSTAGCWLNPSFIAGVRLTPSVMDDSEKYKSKK